jgi:hypothetical protein
VHLDISSPSSGHFTHWNGCPAFVGMAGSLLRFGPGSALAEVTYRAIAVSEPTVDGNVGGLSVAAGYSYEF